MQMREVHHRRRKPWADRMAEKAALGLTRRSVICRLGYATAALLGAKFLVADGPRALAKVATNPPCGLYKSGQAACGKKGIYCGMQDDFACSGPIAGFPDCVLKVGTCPAGTSPGGAWKACCTCPTNINNGKEVTYTDCCGTVDAQKCGNNFAISTLCPQPAPIGCGGCVIADWCWVGPFACTIAAEGGPCSP